MLSTHTSTPDSPQTGRVPQGEFPCSQLVEMGDEDLAEGLDGGICCDCERLGRQIWSERPRYRKRERERKKERERERERQRENKREKRAETRAKRAKKREKREKESEREDLFPHHYLFGSWRGLF